MERSVGVLLILLQCMGSYAQIDLSHITSGTVGTATEVTDTSITIGCALTAGGVAAVDTVCGLAMDTTSTAENGYDVPDLAGYTCTILAGDADGTVTIPLNDDPVIEVADSLVVTCGTGATGGGMVTIAIVDDAADVNNDPMLVVPRGTSYKTSESLPVSPNTITITVDFYDADGNIAPIEEDLDVDFILPTEMSSDTAFDGDDFMLPVSPAQTFVGSAMGEPTISGTILIVLMPDDTVPENLETFNVILKDTAPAAAGSITSDVATRIAIQIADNDKPELVVINDMTPIPRRSKQDVFLWAITNEMTGGPSGISYTWMPHNLKDALDKDITVDGYPVLQTKLSRPKRNSKSRFNEFTYTKVQDFDGTPYTRTARTYVTPTSHTQKQAPIETDTKSTLTVFPDAAVCTELAKTYTISVPSNVKTNRQLRWDFIPEGSFPSDRIKLKKNKGRTSLKIKDCDQAGMYIVYRKDRGKIGWEEYIRVILSACPDGWFTSVAECDTEKICGNGGLVDPIIGLCTCPPGFAGEFCEIALPPGTFGSNCDFNIKDFTGGHPAGKCVMFSFGEPFGVTCAAGFTGNDCCKACPKLTFGANCAQTCNCADDLCDRYSGVCANGCTAGYSGPNCQTGP